MNLENKSIWITGASSGIGEELAKQFSAKGARLILSARSEDKLHKLCDSLDGGAGRHRVQVLDLAYPEQIAEQSEKLMSQVGQVDILINNAGVSQRSLFLDTDLSVYRHLIEVDYLGLIALTKVVSPSMVERGSGVIVAISSVAGKVGTKMRTGYCGAKFAVSGFMESLRTELSPQGVHCLTVYPGYVSTQVAFNALTADGSAQGSNDWSNENGIGVELCAEQIIDAILRQKDEVIIGKGVSRWAPLIKRISPSFYNRMAAKAEHR